MRFLLCGLLTLLMVHATPAQQPAPPTIDQLIDQLVATRKQIADLKKVEADQVAALQAKVKDLQDRLAALNITPPGPDPAPPPKPVDPLVQKVRDAVTLDKATHDQVLQLAALYRLAAKLAADPTVPSSAELLRRVGTAAADLAESLTAVRVLVAGELLAALGMSGDVPLTDAQRAAAAAAFTKFATILEGL